MNDVEFCKALQSVREGRGEYGIVRQCKPCTALEALDLLEALRRLLVDILEDFDALTSGAGGPSLGSECTAIAWSVTLRIAKWRGLWEDGETPLSQL